MFSSLKRSLVERRLASEVKTGLESVRRRIESGNPIVEMSTLHSDRQGVLATCPSCGKTNRLRYANLDRAIRCGNCHATLPPPGEPVEASDVASFDAIVQGTRPFQWSSTSGRRGARPVA